MEDDLANFLDLLDAGGLSRPSFSSHSAPLGAAVIVGSSAMGGAAHAAVPWKGGILKMGIRRW